MSFKYSTNEINTLRVNVQHTSWWGKECEIGVKFDQNNSIILFCLDKNINNHFPRVAAWVCYQVLRCLNIKGELYEYNWLYVAPPVVSEIRFHARHN